MLPREGRNSGSPLLHGVNGRARESPTFFPARITKKSIPVRFPSRAHARPTYDALHERDLAFVKQAVAESKAKHKVVVTHHVPTRLCVAKEFEGSAIGSGFVVDLTDYIESSGIDVWIYGHSHRSIDRQIGLTRVVSNQVGYVQLFLYF